jgi:hypothetical protein
MVMTWERIRFILASGLLILAWRKLNQWYAFRERDIFLLFLICSVAGFALAIPRNWWSKLRAVRRDRLLAVGFLLLLALPWAEWFQFSDVGIREDWTAQLFFQAIFLLGVLLLFRIFPVLSQFMSATLQWSLQRLSQRRLSFFLIPVFFFCFAAGIEFFLFQRLPLIQDSAAYLFQAKIFREGRIFAPAPPEPEFFSVFGDMLVLQKDRWFSMYQPGYPLLLALGLFLNAEWLVTPLLGAGIVWLWMFYIRRWHQPGLAILFGILALFSPFLLLMSSTWMVFVPELFLLSLLLVAIRLQMDEERQTLNVLLFFNVAFLMTVRAFSSVCFVAPLILYTVYNKIRARSYGTILAICLGFVSGAGVLLYYQAQTTGDPFLAAYAMEYPDLKLGFGGDPLYEHTLSKGLANVSNNILGINTWLNGWLSGSLLFIVIGIVRGKAWQQWDLVLFVCAVTLMLFYFSFFYQDLIFGPRYYFPLAPILLFLIARSAFPSPHSLTRAGNVTVPALLFFCLVSFFPFSPGRYLNRYEPASTVWGMLNRAVEREEGRLLVFLESSARDYLVGWNDPFLRGRAIVVRSLEGRNEEIQKHYPQHRPVYFRSDTGEGALSANSTFRLFDEPDRNPPGYLSLFKFAEAVRAASQYSDVDLFDVCYSEELRYSNATLQIQFVRDKLNSEERSPKDYRYWFRQGLFHLAIAVLMPKSEAESKSKNWHQTFDFAEFERQLKVASLSLRRSGETGLILLTEVEKAMKRIDRNGDSVLSPEESRRYLDTRLFI